MKKLAYMALASVAALVAACNGEGKGSAAEVLLTDTITIADSMNYSKSTAEVTISGLYPAGGVRPMVDSVRLWLAECLSWGAFTTDIPLIHVSRREIADGQLLIEHVNQKLQAAAKRDFIFLAGDSIKAGYEYQINFTPNFQSDSLLTYEYTTYAYQGGAHGNSVVKAATFVVPSGKHLTYDNIFQPGADRKVIDLVKKGLLDQYFKPAADSQAAAAVTLKGSLLVEPDAVELPICGPQFGADGITFIYGQYEIAPYAAGMPSCTLPYSELRPFLRSEILPLLPLPQPGA